MFLDRFLSNKDFETAVCVVAKELVYLMIFHPIFPSMGLSTIEGWGFYLSLFKGWLFLSLEF